MRLRDGDVAIHLRWATVPELSPFLGYSTAPSPSVGDGFQAETNSQACESAVDF
jgi:hypothetical protein